MRGRRDQGTVLAESGATCIASKDCLIGEQGATATASGGAHHALRAVAGLIRLQAAVRPRGSGG